MRQKHDARAYFGKNFIVFDFLRNPAPNWLRNWLRNPLRKKNKNWDKIMNVYPLVVKQILGRL